jgi:hypothetical protein
LIARGDSHKPATSRPKVLRQIISRIPFLQAAGNPFDCAAPPVVSVVQGRSRTVAMIETITAFFGFISASIFLAHAYEGYRSRPVLQKRRFRKL